MKKKSNKLFIIVCLLAVFASLLLCGCGDQKDESCEDISVNTEASETVSDTEVSADEVSKEVSEGISEEMSKPEESTPAEHTHAYSDVWSSNETDHWKECECGDKADIANHAFGEWTTTKEATEDATGSKKRTCSTCGYEETATIPMLSHTHDYAKEWSSNETDHWHECKCGDKADVSSHTYGDWTTTKAATEETEGSKYHTCTTCSYKETVTIPVLSHTHSFGNWRNNATSHWKECKCGDKAELSSHTYGGWEIVIEATCTATGTKKHTCTACGYSETATIPVIAHTYGDWKSNATSHWKECKCGNTANKENHTYISVVTPPTETEKGYTTHTCGKCGYSHVDSYVDTISTYSIGLKYEISSKATCTIIGIGTCEDTDLNIPPEIDGYKVTRIGIFAFSQCKNLTSVTIPDSVSYIGPHAFEYCRALNSVTIPNSVTEIGEFAFLVCTNLTNINIPNSVTIIGNGAFRTCENLTSVTIPDSVIKISNSMFAHCYKLTSITIPHGVTTINPDAFLNCSSLESITIPDSLTSVSHSAFYKCTNLTTVYFSASEDDWKKIEIGMFNSELTNATIHYNAYYCKVTLSIGNSGSISVKDELYEIENNKYIYVPLGESITLVFESHANYKLDTVKVGGKTIQLNENNEYTIKCTDTVVTVSATFRS